MPQAPLSAFIGQKLGSTSYVAAQFGKQREMWVAQRHASLYAGAYAGLSGFGANQSGAVASLFSATPGAVTGLILSNPAGSTVNLAVQKVTGALVVATSAITAFALVTGYSAAGIVTIGTSLTASNIVGAATTAFQGVAAASATLVGTPTVRAVLADAVTTTVAGTFFAVSMDGEVLIPPGGYACINTLLTAGPSAGFYGSISWEEVPL
jgi:hypothetical protein